MADPDRLADGELQQLAYGIETRFAPHVEAAASAVRAAERDLAEARERLERAVAAAEQQRYRSDPLVFMRELLAEEVDGLERKTNPKKLRTSFRFLVDRAVELAAGEVQGFHDEREAVRPPSRPGVPRREGGRTARARGGGRSLSGGRPSRRGDARVGPGDAGARPRRRARRPSWADRARGQAVGS